MTSLRDIAQDIGLSYSTVSAVMRNREVELGLRPETCRVVREAARRLGYTPNIAARGLRSGRSFLVGVLTDNGISKNALVAPMLQGLGDALMQEKMGVLIGSYGTMENLKQQIDFLIERNVDGVVICWDSRPEFRREQERLLLQKLAVGVGADFDLSGIPWVSTDPEAMARLAAEHLLELGHRNIALLGRREKYDEAFSAMVEAAGGKVWHLWEYRDLDGGRTALRRILAEKIPVTAVLAYSDINAAGILAEANAQGVSVPDKLSVMGVDNLPITQMVHPCLTTVAQSFSAQGEYAGRLITDLIGGKKPESVLLSPELVVRESTGRVTVTS